MVAAPEKQESFSLTDELYYRLVCNGFEPAFEWYASQANRCPLFPLFKVDEILKRAMNSTENKVVHGNFQITKERRMELAGKLHEYVAALPKQKQSQFEEMLIRTPDPHRLQFLKGTISKQYLLLITNAPLENCCPGCDALLKEPANESTPVEFRQSAPISESLLMENTESEHNNNLVENVAELPRTPSLGFFRFNESQEKQAKIPVMQTDAPRVQMEKNEPIRQQTNHSLPNTMNTPFGNAYTTGAYAGSRMKKNKITVQKKNATKRKTIPKAKIRTNTTKKNTPKKTRFKKRK